MGDRKVETIHFQSKEGERDWLRGLRAYTGRLNSGFSWQEHGEELKSGCAGLLRLRYLGSNLMLIHGEKETITLEVLEGLDKWAISWFEWWKEWKASDTNRCRTVWTRWIGVPLNAWSARFFKMGFKSLGRMVELHKSTEKKEWLEAAFVKLETECNLVNRNLTGLIDGNRFSIRIDELIPSIEDIEFGSASDDELSSVSGFSEWESWSDDDSVVARMVAG